MCCALIGRCKWCGWEVFFFGVGVTLTEGGGAGGWWVVGGCHVSPPLALVQKVFPSKFNHPFQISGREYQYFAPLLLIDWLIIANRFNWLRYALRIAECVTD